jgi:hypothetical protein
VAADACGTSKKFATQRLTYLEQNQSSWNARFWGQPRFSARGLHFFWKNGMDHGTAAARSCSRNNLLTICFFITSEIILRHIRRVIFACGSSRHTRFCCSVPLWISRKQKNRGCLIQRRIRGRALCLKAKGQKSVSLPNYSKLLTPTPTKRKRCFWPSRRAEAGATLRIAN